MSTFLTRQSLPRRTFLRGMGATLSLPLLDAMIPAATAATLTAAQPTRRHKPAAGDHRPARAGAC